MAVADVCFGDRVSLQDSTEGTVRFIGHTSLNGLFYGIHLDQKVGENNGSIENRTYFKCPPDCGTFVRREDIKEITKKHKISASFAYNQQVQIFETKSKGKIKYIGMTDFGNGLWYGIKLETSLKSKPKSKFIHYLKSKQNNTYFDGNDKNSIFVRPNQLRCIQQSMDTKEQSDDEDNIYMIEFKERPFGITFDKNKRDPSNLFVSIINEQICKQSQDIIIGSYIIKIENEYVEGKGHKNISKLLNRKYGKKLPLKITFRKPQRTMPKSIRSHVTLLEKELSTNAKRERRNSEPLTPSSMDSKPLTPSRNVTKTRTVSMGFNIRKEYLVKNGQFPNVVSVNKNNQSVQFKKRNYPKSNLRQFRVRKSDGSEVHISESVSDGMLFVGCDDVSDDNKKKKKKSKTKKKKKARPRSDSVHQRKNKKKSKAKKGQKKRAHSDGLNKRKMAVTKKSKSVIELKSNKKRKSSKKSAKKSSNNGSNKSKSKLNVQSSKH